MFWLPLKILVTFLFYTFVRSFARSLVRSLVHSVFDGGDGGTEQRGKITNILQFLWFPPNIEIKLEILKPFVSFCFLSFEFSRTHTCWRITNVRLFSCFVWLHVFSSTFFFVLHEKAYIKKCEDGVETVSVQAKIYEFATLKFDITFAYKCVCACVFNAIQRYSRIFYFDICCILQFIRFFFYLFAFFFGEKRFKPPLPPFTSKHVLMIMVGWFFELTQHVSNIFFSLNFNGNATWFIVCMSTFFKSSVSVEWVGVQSNEHCK